MSEKGSSRLKKKRLIIISAAALVSALVITTLIFTTCLSSRGAVVMTYGNTTITEPMFKYWMSTYKANYITYYNDVSDTVSFWDGIMEDGKTGEEYLNSKIIENIKMNAVAAEIFRQSGLKISAETSETVNKKIKDLINDYGEGSEKTLNSLLAQYGVNTDILREIYLTEMMCSQLYSYMYGTNGAQKVSDSDIDDYFNENYIRVKWIQINTVYKLVVDEDGNYVYEGENGKYKTEKLTEKEKAEKLKDVSEVSDSLEDGVDFDTLFTQYSDSKDNADGYYFHKSKWSEFFRDVIPEMKKAAINLEVGKWDIVSTEDYGYFFIFREELAEKAYSDAENEGAFEYFTEFNDMVKEELFNKYIYNYVGSVVTNDEIISKYSVRNISANYYY